MVKQIRAIGDVTSVVAVGGCGLTIFNQTVGKGQITLMLVLPGLLDSVVCALVSIRMGN